MRKSHRHSGAYRALWAWEAESYAAHLKRLDPMARRRRFHAAVSDQIIEAHAAKALNDPHMRVIGWFKDGALRGAAEIAIIDLPAGREAEASFAVEASDRRHGVGRQLLARAALYARNRKARRLHIATEAENAPMIRLAMGSGAAFEIEQTDADGVIDMSERTVFSIGLEAYEEEAGLIGWALSRLGRALTAPFRRRAARDAASA